MAKGSVSKVSRKNALKFLANKTGVGTPGPAQETIAERAYRIYLEEGCPDGRHLDHWLRAESELR
jgi:Protein of unknown function (DUF2934)